MTFVMMAVFLVGVAGACLLWPLLRRRSGSSVAAAAALAAHKRKLVRLDAQLAIGELLMPAYLQARAAAESEVRACLEKLAPSPAPVPSGRPRRVTALVASLVLVALAGGLYISIGNWHAAIFGTQTASQSSVEQMVAGLARRLATRDPDDAGGWAMLGRSYVVLGRYPDAESAYAHAYALSGDHDPGLLADYAEAMVLADPAQLTTAAAPLLEKALQAEPDNPKALWYGGLLAQAHHDPKLAAQRWQKILTGDPPPGIRDFVQQHLAELSGAVDPAPAAPEAKPLSIPVYVALTPALTRRIPAGATLFVFVRPAGAQGGLPLLAARLPASGWPVSLKLTSADAMVPGTSLTGYRQLEVTARLSADGNAQPHAGDMEGSTVFKVASEPNVAKVTIDHVLH